VARYPADRGVLEASAAPACATPELGGHAGTHEFTGDVLAA